MKFQIDNIVVELKKIHKAVSNIDGELTSHILKKTELTINDIESYHIVNKSVDARKKSNIKLNYRVVIECKPHLTSVKNGKVYEDKPEPYVNLKSATSAIVVGTGPAGLMSALILAKAGCNPIILDRGFKVEQRSKDIENFIENRELNEDSNYLYGEGGAGTYSDGKLYTRKRDVRTRFILDEFVEAGASDDILYLSHPHIGSDVLPEVVKNIREKIISLGGEFLWGSKVVDIVRDDNKCTGVILQDGSELLADKIVIATGHSSRELIKQLIKQDVEYKLKDFQIGCRIEHKQAFINTIRYGVEYYSRFLSVPEYNIVSRPKAAEIANVTSFCMCPGGEVIPAVCEKGNLTTNGMSNFKRDGEFANSALIVNQKADGFKDADEAFGFLDNIEKELFKAGGENYSCPVQNAYSFCSGEEYFPGMPTSYKMGIVPGKLDLFLPKQTVTALKEALRFFESSMPGFMQSGTLIGIETKVSSPVRFIRDKETMQSSIENLYLIGEGAGCAGGIISAAIDGLKCAEKIVGI